MEIIKAETGHIEQIIALDESVIGSRCREAIIRNAVIEGRCYAIEADGIIAAYAIINSNFFDRNFIELLIVKKEYRRKGLGRGLLNSLIDGYCRDGSELFTSTNSTNFPMQRLLNACGFICCGNIGGLDEGDPELIYRFEVKPGLFNSNETLDSFVHRLAAENDFSGAVHISRKGGADDFSYENAFGYANRDWKIESSIVTRFNTASISKVFTACGILKLAERGELKLDDKLCDHLLFEGEPFSKEITLYHLLTHSSGIADDADEEAGENYEDIFIDKPNYRFRKASDLVENFIGKAPVFQPGEGCRYNNAGYVLLGMVIEKVTGMEYKAWLTENILKPWDLTSTGFPSMDWINENTAEGYVFDEGVEKPACKKNIYSIPPIGTPEGGIYSTAGDLCRLMRGLVEGQFFNEFYTGLLMTPKVYHADYDIIQHYMGFGLEFYLKDGKTIRIQKDGSNPGVSAVMSYYPESGTSIVILANTNCNVWEMLHQMEEYLHILC